MFEWLFSRRKVRQKMYEYRLRYRICCWFEMYYSKGLLMLPTDVIRQAERSADRVMNYLINRKLVGKFRTKLPYKYMVKECV